MLIQFLDGTSREVPNLYGANLYGANLYGANLRSADLRSANLIDCDVSAFVVAGEGDLIGYKKLADNTIAVLRIPSDARRVNAIGSRKCRAEYAVVISGAGVSQHQSSFRYMPGATVRPTEPFCDDVRVECASGIHFFITRQEAENY